MAESDSWRTWSKHVFAELERLGETVDILDSRIDKIDNLLTRIETEDKLCRKHVTKFIDEYYASQRNATNAQTSKQRSDRSFTLAIIACGISALISATSAVVSILRFAASP